MDKTKAEGVKANIPWDTLRYLIGKVMYGGRVIDNYDQRVVNTFMEEYFGEFLVDVFQTFYFYHDETVSYVLPDNDDKINYLSIIGIRYNFFVFDLKPNTPIYFQT